MKNSARRIKAFKTGGGDAAGLPACAPVDGRDGPSDVVPPGRLAAFAGKLRHIKGVVVALASVGAVASGLVGYYTTYQAVSKEPLAAPPAAIVPNAVAVMPFVNMSDDKENEYFSDGLSEELLNVLVTVPQLNVIARASSFSFKGKNADVATIVKALHVGHLVEGSVRKAGKMVRISARLTRTADSKQLWSQSYDRQLTDVLAVQDEIAQAVVAALQVKLLPNQTVAGVGSRSTNAKAISLYLQGHAYFLRTGLSNFLLARAALIKAIALDPAYAAAYAELAIVEDDIGDHEQGTASQRERFVRAMAWANKAIELDPQLGLAYNARSHVRQVTMDWHGMLADAKRAVQLDPGASRIHLRYGKALMTVGQFGAAMAELKKAESLDPLDPETKFRIALLLMLRDDPASAHAKLLEGQRLNTDYSEMQIAFGLSYLSAGDIDKARAEFEVLTIPSEQMMALAMLSLKKMTPVDAAQHMEALAKEHGATFPYEIAALYAWRGQSDQAFAWLQRADAMDPYRLGALQVDPLFMALRNDPRWSALLRKKGLLLAS